LIDPRPRRVDQPFSADLVLVAKPSGHLVRSAVVREEVGDPALELIPQGLGHRFDRLGVARLLLGALHEVEVGKDGGIEGFDSAGGLTGKDLLPDDGLVECLLAGGAIDRSRRHRHHGDHHA
jgi:hypothetical protein